MGINVLGTLILVFAIAGFFSGVAGMQYYMKLLNISPMDLRGSHANALAAVIFGGTQLGTGRGGSVEATLIGVVTITLINTSLVMLGVPSYAQKFTVGVLIMGSVVMAAYRDFNWE